MQKYKKKFDELYSKKQSIKIRIFDEEPLTKKFVRYNQGGEACSCIEGSNKARQKTKNGYQCVECNLSTCPYRQKNEQGKAPCNRIAWFKFLMPEICTDRIFLMRITGQTSIDRLDEYFNFQKLQGNSIKNDYTLFLKQEEQTNSFAKSFNNYVLDIFNENEFKQLEQVSNNTKIQNQNPKVLTNVEDKNEISNTTSNVPNEEAKKSESTSDTKQVKKTTAKKESKSKTKVQEEMPKEPTIEDLDNSFNIIKTERKKMTTKKGEIKEFLIGNFADIDTGETVDIVIDPNYAEELEECGLGTIVKLDIIDSGKIKYAKKVDYVYKIPKKEVA